MKPFLTITLAALSFVAVSQSNQVTNSFNYLKNKEYDKAKASTDAAAEHESTKNSPKMWMYRGDIYRAIFEHKDEPVRNLDMEAEEKSLEAYMNCLKIDLKDNSKSPIYKEDVKGPVVISAAATNRKAAWYGTNKQFDKALKCYDLVEAALIYDFDQGMKRNNITKEKLLYNKYDMFKKASDFAKMQEYADKLIAINYKDPDIFIKMTQVMLGSKDTAKALDYIDKGKKMFDDNMDLINLEIDIFIKQKRSAALIEKLQNAISINDNEVMHVILGQVYEQTKDYTNAEKEYLKSVEINPNYELGLYKIGALYYVIGSEYNNKAADLPAKEVAKNKEYLAKKEEYYKKSIVHLEKCYEFNSKDKAVNQRLFRMYAQLGDTEKAAKYK